MNDDRMTEDPSKEQGNTICPTSPGHFMAGTYKKNVKLNWNLCLKKKSKLHSQPCFLDPLNNHKKLKFIKIMESIRNYK